MTDLIRIVYDDLAFGVTVEKGTVVDAAPVGRWMIGKPFTECVAYWQRRGATIEGNVMNVADMVGTISIDTTGTDEAMAALNSVPEVAQPTEKPKRKRRTKAEMEAERAAKQGAANRPKGAEVVVWMTARQIGYVLDALLHFADNRLDALSEDDTASLAELWDHLERSWDVISETGQR
jgi:hypothetical protein